MTESRLEVIGYLERFGGLIERGRTILDAGCGDRVPVDQYLVRIRRDLETPWSEGQSSTVERQARVKHLDELLLSRHVPDSRKPPSGGLRRAWNKFRLWVMSQPRRRRG